jgi:hypothetical protein
MSFVALAAIAIALLALFVILVVFGQKRGD